MNYNVTFILQYLNKPLRFIFFTIDELLLIVLPSIAGIYFGEKWMLTGILGAILGFGMLRVIKKRAGNLKYLLYWELGFSGFRFVNSHRLLPDSSVRRYEG